MRSGFTLIELVIGLFISSIILLALYSSFYVTGKVIKVSDDIINIDVHLALIAHQFENDLSGIFVPLQLSSTSTATGAAEPNQQASTPKQAEQEKESPQKEIKDIFVSSNKDTSLQLLSFITNNPLQMHHKEGPGSRMVRVVYRLIPNEDKTAFILTRQESINLDLKAFDVKGQQGIRGYELTQNIKSLQVEFLYPEEKQQDEKKDTKDAKGSDTKAEQQPIAFKTVKEWGKENVAAKEKESIPKIPQFIILTLELWDLNRRQSQTFILNYAIASFNASQQEKKSDRGRPREMLSQEKKGQQVGKIVNAPNTQAKP